MSGMGSYTRKRAFTPTGPAQFMGSMARLLGEQNKSFQGIGDAVEGYGQSRAGGKLADLMGEESFENLNPEQAQAAAMKATGGRTLNKRGENLLSTMMANKNKVQDNTNKENAATTLFGRQNSQIGQRHANSVSLSKMNNKARQKLYGTEEGGINALLDAEGLASVNAEISGLQKMFEKEGLDDGVKTQLKLKLDEAKFRRQKGLTGAKGLTADMKNVWNGGKPGKSGSQNETKAAVPNDLKIGLNSGQTDGLQRGVNSGQLVVTPYESAPDTDGKTYRRYKVTDSMGNMVAKKQYSRF